MAQQRWQRIKYGGSTTVDGSEAGVSAAARRPASQVAPGAMAATPAAASSRPAPRRSANGGPQAPGRPDRRRHIRRPPVAASRDRIAGDGEESPSSSFKAAIAL
jgi:hypothetical protein